jgi:hypothetical protein
MDQTVMSFAGTAARGSAIPSPVEGMYTHLEDTDNLEFYNGSSWASPFGLTKLTNQPFTAQSSISVDNVFSSSYRNYRFILMISDKSTNSTISCKLRVGGVDTSTNYNTAGISNRTSGTSVVFGQAGAAAYTIGFGNTNSDTGFVVDVLNPNIADATIFSGNGFGSDATSFFQISSGSNQTASTQFDGFSIITSTGTITGTLEVYGYRS